MRQELIPIEQKAKALRKRLKKQRIQIRAVQLLYTKILDPKTGMYQYRNNVTLKLSKVKPAAITRYGEAYDAPTPRTRRKIIMVAATGPSYVVYPPTFARNYGIYGGRTQRNEVEASTCIKRCIRQYIRRKKAQELFLKQEKEQRLAYLQSFMPSRRGSALEGPAAEMVQWVESLEVYKEGRLHDSVCKLQRWWRVQVQRREVAKESQRIVNSVYCERIMLLDRTRNRKTRNSTAGL